MNLVKSTANKVMELEKRLDNELLADSLKVTELKRDFGPILMDEFAEYDMATFDGGQAVNNIVLQGEIRVRVLAACNIVVTLIFDGYEIYSRVNTYEPGVHSITVLRTIAIAPETSQKLVLRIERKGGGVAELATYNFFVWGYGENFGLDERVSEPKLSGASDGENFAVFIVSNNIGYAGYYAGFPDSLDSGDLTNFGSAVAVAPVFLDYESTDETTGDVVKLSSPVQFVVKSSGELVMVEGALSTAVDFDSCSVIDTGVTAVTATRVLGEDTAVVAYSKGSSVFYFTFDGVTRSECMEIYSFGESVVDVALIQNSTSTTFLAVELSSGKNYLFSSVTQVSAGVKSSRIKAKLSIVVK